MGPAKNMPAGIFTEWERGFALARFGGNEPQLRGAHGSLIAVGNAEFPDYALYVDLEITLEPNGEG